MAYAEHVGVKRQHGGRPGEMYRRYSRINPINPVPTKDTRVSFESVGRSFVARVFIGQRSDGADVSDDPNSVVISSISSANRGSRSARQRAATM
jgi:hypothetical protein